MSLRQGCLSVIAGLAVVAVGGYVYLSLNPPFALPETGYLSASTQRDVRLGPASSAAAFHLRVEPSSGIYAASAAAFPPVEVVATIRDPTAEGDVSVWVLPASTVPVPMRTTGEAGSSVAWDLDCAAAGRGPCSGEYIVVVNSTAPSTEIEVTLDISAEQTFPAHVPTPFLVGISLGADEIDLPDGAVVSDSDDHRSATLHPDEPVATFALAFDGSADAAVGGTTLTVSVERNEAALPTGLAAPPPVRLALLDGDGIVLADVAPRPGTPVRVGLPALRGDHRIVAWWQDWADQSYEITWEIQVAEAGGSGTPSVESGSRRTPPAVKTVLGGGELLINDPGEEGELEFGIETDTVPPAEPGRLPAAIGVLHLRIELVETKSESPLLLRIGPDPSAYSSAAVPVPLREGRVAELVVDGMAACLGWKCDGWRGRLSNADPLANSSVRGTVRWDSILVLWPLEPGR